MFTSAVVLVSAVASEAAEEGGEVAPTSPFLYGGVALATLLLLLFVTTRLNIDR
jgi:hypothetical protein